LTAKAPKRAETTTTAAAATTMEIDHTINGCLSGQNGKRDNPCPPQFDTRPTMDLPAVVACGYKRIKIPKSGNSFPAFLVAFEYRNPSENEKCIEDTNKQNDMSSIAGVRFSWRSKKDFLLLARKGTGATQDQTLPKAALKKVVEETNVPWRRSSILPTKVGGVGSRSSSCEEYTKAATAMEQGGLHRRFQEVIPDCLCHRNLPNMFSARMKKSIWQMDRFLQSVKREAEENERDRNAWEIFCRPGDTKDLFTPREFSASEILLPSNESTNAQVPDCKGENETPLGDLSAPVTADANETIDASMTLRESSRLGQYFASEENSQKAVECALEKILPLYRRGDNAYDNRCHSTTKILFVEPSCGHGDIVVSLVRALKEHNIQPGAVWIMGYDIDPGAIQTCRRRKELLSRDAKSGDTNNNRSDDGEANGGSDYPVRWECKSFFDTTREDCIQSFDRVSKDNDANCKAANDNTKIQLAGQELLVCCIGGPPYTTGQGSGSAMKRDLPERFVEHCLTEWKADAVSFLMPARYKEGMKKIFDEGTLMKTQQDGSIAKTESPANHREKRWIYETHELEASTFFFRGTTKVTQPSIIQVFYESKVWNAPDHPQHSNRAIYAALEENGDASRWDDRQTQ
jgi:hypothetical protein